MGDRMNTVVSNFMSAPSWAKASRSDYNSWSHGGSGPTPASINSTPLLSRTTASIRDVQKKKGRSLGDINAAVLGDPDVEQRSLLG